MKVTQEKLPASKLGLEIEVTPDMSQKAYEQVIQQFSRQASIPGFRKGKVPRSVLVQRMGTSRIKAAAVEDLIQNCLEKVVKDEEIPALGNFQLISSFDELVTQYEPGEPLVFSVSVDVPPEVSLSDYTGLSIRAEEVKYDPAEVDQFLEERRKEQATLIPVEERAAQAEDVAIVDYVGKIINEAGGEPQPLPGGEAENFQIELSEGRFIKGFVEGIIGLKVGETKELNVPFPEDYPNEDLAGKEAIFTITVKELKEKELPELDDDFAQAVSEYQTLAELRESLEKQYQEKADRETKANKHEALVTAIEKIVEVEIPETLIDRELDNILQQSMMQLANYGIDVKKLYTKDTVAALRKQSQPEAIENLRKSFALKEVAARESLSVTPEEVNARIEELKDRLPPDVDRDRLTSALESEMLKEKALDWLEERANIELLPAGTLEAEAAATAATAAAEAAEAELAKGEESAGEVVPVEATDSPE
ncbi:trigger factor [Laspinema sp. A4]|uniref:trigger factor n=1 Tax=Laspinema sp. D2d TaxID=2953686 RepID=UPI0021BA4E74|nr:trigger factor [Laspinema sp. D2d]MCT7983916.1 trigger factor [Laspinema sp. D2d]